MMAMDAPMPDDGSDDGTNSYTFNASSFTLPDYGTNLWIAQVGISSGSLVGIVSNSQPDISYEIQSLKPGATRHRLEFRGIHSRFGINELDADERGAGQSDESYC